MSRQFLLRTPVLAAAVTIAACSQPAAAPSTAAKPTAEPGGAPSSIVVFVSGKRPAQAKDGETLTETRAEISVTKPGDEPVASGGMRGVVVTITKASDAAMSGTISLPAVSAAAKNVAGAFHNAIVCEET